MPVLQEMLPRELLDYCQEHGLLESVLIQEEDDRKKPPHNQFGPDEFGTVGGNSGEPPAYSSAAHMPATEEQYS